MVFGTCFAAQDSVQRECVRSSIRVSQLFFSVTAATRISEAASSERLGMFEARRSLQPVLAESLQRALADDHVAEMRFVICAVEVCRVGPRGGQPRGAAWGQASLRAVRNLLSFRRSDYVAWLSDRSAALARGRAWVEFEKRERRGYVATVRDALAMNVVVSVGETTSAGFALLSREGKLHDFS